MESSLVLALLGALIVIANAAPVAPGPISSFVTRNGTSLLVDNKPWKFSGMNIYWLGLDENPVVAYPTHFRIDDALQTAAEMGANVVRSHTLGISYGRSQSLKPTKTTWNDDAFDTIDYAIYRASQLGIRLIVPLTDHWCYYHGGRCTWTAWYGKLLFDNFYTDPDIISGFLEYVDYLLNHVNSFNGIAIKDDPTILFWESGNEIHAPAAWVKILAQHVKALAPNTLFQDGSLPTDGGVFVDEVDACTTHFYPMDSAKLANDVLATMEAGKVYYAGEYSVYDESHCMLGDWHAAVEQNEGVSGDLWWSLFPHADSQGFVQHQDKCTVHYPGDNADMAERAADTRAHAFKMRGLPLPPSSTPLQPLITAITNAATGPQIQWRGSAMSAVYSIQHAGSADGPWVTVCSGCVNDNQSPWVDSGLTSGMSVRIQGINLDGIAGDWSPIFNFTAA